MPKYSITLAIVVDSDITNKVWVEELIKLGYSDLRVGWTSYKHILVTDVQGSNGELGNWSDTAKISYHRTLVDPSWPKELVLALAAATEGSNFIPGEWAVATNSCTGEYTTNKLYQIKEEHAGILLTVLDNKGCETNGWNIVNFRKPTKDEIIAYFTLSSKIFDTNFHMYAANIEQYNDINNIFEAKTGKRLGGKWTPTYPIEWVAEEKSLYHPSITNLELNSTAVSPTEFITKYKIQKVMKQTFTEKEYILFTDKSVMEFALKYAREKGVAVATNSLNSSNVLVSRYLGVSVTDELGLVGGDKYDDAILITLDDFITRCNNYAKNVIPLTSDYKCKVNYVNETLVIGCQKTTFAKLFKLYAVINAVVLSTGNGFNEGDGVVVYDSEVATMLRTYALSKHIPCYNNSGTNKGYHAMYFHDGDLMSTDANNISNRLTMEEFIVKCNAIINQSKIERITPDYDATVDYITKTVVINSQKIPFDTINKLYITIQS